MSTEASPLNDEEFTSAVELLRQLLPNDALDRLQPRHGLHHYGHFVDVDLATTGQR